MGGLLLLLSLAGCREDAEAAPCDRSAGTWVSPEAGAGALQAAVDAAGKAGGAVVGMLPGVYVEALRLGSEHDGVRVIACPGTVEVAGVDAETPVVEVEGVDASPLVSFDGLRLVGGRDGLFAQGGAVGLHDVEIVDAGVGSTSALAAGVFAAFGATVDLDGVRVEGAAASGVVASTASTRITLTDSVIADVRRSGTRGALGVWAYGGAELLGQEVDIEAPAGGGVVVDGSSTLVTLEGGRIAAAEGVPVTVSSGGRFSAAGLAIEGGAESGIVVEGVDLNGSPSLAELDGCTLTWVATERANIDTAGLMVFGGGSLAFRDSTLTEAGTVGLLADGVGTFLSIERSSIDGTRPTAGGGFGVGAVAQFGATLEVSASSLAENHLVGVLATDAGTFVTLTDTRVGGTRRGTDLASAMGVAVQLGAEVRGAALVVTDTEGPGLYVAAGTFDCAGCALDHNTFAGALLADGALTLTDSTITGTGADAELGGGTGVLATDRFGSPRLVMFGVTVGPHRYAATWLDGEGSYQILASALAGGPGFESGGTRLHGNALFATRVGAWSGTTGLRVESTELGGSDGVGVLLHDASGAFASTTWTPSAVDLIQQHCATFPALTTAETDGAPVSVVCPGPDVLVDTSMVYRGLRLLDIATADP